MILTGRRELRALRIAIFLQFRMQIARCRVHCNFGRTAAEKGKDRVLHTVLQFPPVYVFFLLSLSLSLFKGCTLDIAGWAKLRPVFVVFLASRWSPSRATCARSGSPIARKFFSGFRWLISFLVCSVTVGSKFTRNVLKSSSSKIFSHFIPFRCLTSCSVHRQRFMISRIFFFFSCRSSLHVGKSYCQIDRE